MFQKSSSIKHTAQETTNGKLHFCAVAQVKDEPLINLMMIMIMHCFCYIVDRRKWDFHPRSFSEVPTIAFFWQISSDIWTSPNLISNFVEWRRAVVLNSTPRSQVIYQYIMLLRSIKHTDFQLILLSLD